MRPIIARAMFAFAPSLSLVLLSLSGAPAHGQTIYGLSGDSLIRFDAATPGAVTTIGTIDAFVSNISFRPSDGRLYGYETSFTGTDAIYTIDLDTAAVTLVATSTPGTNTGHVGTAFDPNSDTLRVITDLGENRGVTIEDSVTSIDNDLAYAPGDPFDGRFPLIIDIAYSPGDSGFFGIDYLRDRLVRFDPASEGTLTTVGALGVNTDFITGFDIFQAANTTLGYAAFNPSFNPDSPSTLHTINLATGEATPVGVIGAPGVYSLAIAPAAAFAAAPEPGSLALVMLLLPAVPLLRRRVKRNPFP